MGDDSLIFAKVVRWMFYATLLASVAAFTLTISEDDDLENTVLDALFVFTLAPLIALIVSLPFGDGRVVLMKIIVIFELLLALATSFHIFPS